MRRSNLVTRAAGTASLPSDPDGLVRIIVEIPERENDCDCSPVVEEGLWAVPAGNARYIIDNIPFYAMNVNYKDVVSARKDARTGNLIFDRVVEGGGHSTFRVISRAGWNQEQHDAFHQILRFIKDLGCVAEADGPEFFAIDVPPETSAHAVFDALVIGVDAGVWDFDGPDYSNQPLNEPGGSQRES